MSNIDNQIHLLQTDPFHAITVINMERGDKLYTNFTGEQMVEEFGSVKGFFENLYAKKYTNVRIIPRRKNGSAYKDNSNQEAFNILLSPKDQPAPPLQGIAMPASGNTGLLGQLGLGVMDVMNMNAENLVLKQQVADLASIKAENARLTERVKQLEKEQLEDKYNIAKKQNTTSEIVTAIKSLAPLAMKFLGDKTGMVEAPALNGHGGLSPAQQILFDVLKDQPDTIIETALTILEGLNSPEVAGDLIEVLTKHNILQNG